MKIAYNFMISSYPISINFYLANHYLKKKILFKSVLSIGYIKIILIHNAMM